MWKVFLSESYLIIYIKGFSQLIIFITLAWYLFSTKTIQWHSVTTGVWLFHLWVFVRKWKVDEECVPGRKNVAVCRLKKFCGNLYFFPWVWIFFLLERFWMSEEKTNGIIGLTKDIMVTMKKIKATKRKTKMLKK